MMCSPDTLKSSGPCRRPLVVLVGLLAVLGACSTSSDEPQAATNTTAVAPGSSAQATTASPIPDVVARVQPSVVTVLTDQGRGSGVVWDGGGLVVTNDHVVAGTRRIEVAFADGQRSPAELVASDPQTDVAVVRTSRSALPAAVFADALPRVGELAIAMATRSGSRTR